MISASVKKAQQALSDKYGIVTFNRKGGISTVPSSGKITKKINVGLGRFKDTHSLNRAIQRKISGKKQHRFLKRKGFNVKKPSGSPDVIRPPTFNKRKSPVQTPAILSKSVISAQQALSDKFGIATFNRKGGISTVPKSGIFSDINFGLGKFQNFGARNEAILEKFKPAPTIKPQQITAPTTTKKTSNFFTKIFNLPAQDPVTGQNIQDEQTGLPEIETNKIIISGAGGGRPDTSSSESEGFINSILNDPVKLTIAGVAVIGLIMLGGKN